jgi:hypothetical protein
MLFSIQISKNMEEGLFQLFTAFAYAIKYSKVLIISDKSPTYINFFSDKIKTVVHDLTYPTLKEPASYVELPKININFMLSGKYQSYHYFHEQRDSILKMLNIYTKSERNTSTISLCLQTNMSTQYYKKSINTILSESIGENWTIFYFTEHGNVIDELQATFPSIIFTKYIDTKYNKLLKMIECSHNIVSYDLLGWWGAYLNRCEHKIVCRPSDDGNNDFYPLNWKVI